jgi:hypothetical protein
MDYRDAILSFLAPRKLYFTGLRKHFVTVYLQIRHAHSGGRGTNVGGGQRLSNGMNIGGTTQGLSSSLGSRVNRNYVSGMSFSGNTGSGSLNGKHPRGYACSSSAR